MDEYVFILYYKGSTFILPMSKSFVMRMVLTDVVAKWLSSTHDSFRLFQSTVRRKVQAGAVPDGWLHGKICAMNNLKIHA